MDPTNFTLFQNPALPNWHFRKKKLLLLLPFLFLLIGSLSTSAQVFVTLSATDVTCPGGNDGTATAVGGGGWAPYTYEWDTGDTTSTITGLTAGTYTVTVTDIDLGYDVGSITVGEPPALGSIFNITPETCPGSGDGSTTVIAFGGTPGYTYEWSNGGTSEEINNLPAGTYFITVTDSNGCTHTNSVEIEVSQFGILSNIQSTPSGCDDNDGTATVTPYTGTAPFTYLWSDGQTNATATGLAQGTYGVTITDANGCTGINLVEVEGGTSIDLFLSASYETCPGSNDGTASVNAAGGNPPYTYLWSDGQTFVVASGLSAGIYTVTVTDEDGCTAVGSVEVELSPEGIWLMLSSTDADCGANNGTAHVSVMTGTAPYTYIWDDPAGTTNADPINLAPGTYCVTVTDANGCSNSECVEVEQNSNLIINTSSTDADCGENNGTATVDVSGGTGPFTYEWSNGGNTETITGLGAGTYCVTVTDAEDCSNTECVDVDDTGGITVTATSTDALCGVNNGTASANASGGSGVYTYEWSNGETTQNITGLAPGPYTVTATDTNGCTDSATVMVGDQGDVDVSVSTTDADCNQDNGTATANPSGGDGNYTYEWSNGETTQTITGLAEGTYSVTVTDGNGCTATASGTVDGANVNGGDINTTDPTTICVGDNIPDLIDVTVTGAIGPNMQWIITDDMGNILALPPGPPFDFDGAGVGTCLIWHISYEDGLIGLEVGLNANDLVGCFDLSDPIPVIRMECCEADAGTKTPNGNVCFDGIATISATPNGDANVPAGYDVISVLTQNGIIIGAGPDPQFNVDAPGTYTIHCLVYDPATLDLSIIIFGVTTAAEINALLIQGGGSICASLDLTGATIEVYPSPTVTLSPDDISCNGANDGSITSNAAGGNGPYSYSWSNGANTEDLTNLSAGTYSLTVTDTNGCTATASATVNEPSPLNLTMDGVDETCPGSGDGFVKALVDGGTEPYTYSWSNGANTEIVNDLGPGTYSVTVTDANGCTISGSITIGSGGITFCSATVTSSYNEGVDISTFGGSDGSASASAVGGTQPYTYEWSNGQTGPNASGLSAGTYSVVITDADGCTCIAYVTLHDPAKVGNFFWNDLDRDGIQDPGEPGHGGFTVSLEGFTGTGTPVSRTTTTAPDGSYAFDGLPGGGYKVTFEVPVGYDVSPMDAGGDDSLDSDMDPNTGMTEFFALPLSTCDNTIDGGMYPCVNVGDFVFYDSDADGIQDSWEPGVPNISVSLMTAGPDGIFCNDDDVSIDGDVTGNDGLYLFECVEPGQYYIKFGVNPDDYNISPKDQGGDDELDSDADPATMKTDVFTVFAGVPDDLSHDLGLYDVCDDFTSGGTIGYEQIICEGDFAETLVTVVPPSGGSGTPEYLWLKSTSGNNFPLGNWVEIPNSNTEEYDPGQLFETTAFIRCVRREGCSSFIIESNQLTITVIPYDPANCDDNFGPIVVDISVTELAQEKVRIDWTAGPENELYNYHITRSFDGENFEEIGMERGLGNVLSTNQYSFIDDTPRIGRNYYRVERVELNNGSIRYSNIAELVVGFDGHNFMVYPNPVSDQLNIENIHSVSAPSTLKLYSSTGEFLDLFLFEPAQGKIEVNMNKYPAGIYFISIETEGKEEIEVLRVSKE